MRDLAPQEPQGPQGPTGLSIDAEAVGMGTAAALRQQFRQQIGVSPTAWRKSFAHRAGR